MIFFPTIFTFFYVFLKLIVIVHRNSKASHDTKVHGDFEPSVAPHKCDHCEARFIFFTTFKHHMMRIHNVPEENIVNNFPESLPKPKLKEKVFDATECLVCKKPFTSYYSFICHFGQMHKDQEAGNFFRRLNFEEYTKSKEDYEREKVPYCKVCDKHFSYYTNFLTHVTQIHGKNFSGEFVCNRCDSHFSSEFHLSKHRYTQHPDEFRMPEKSPSIKSKKRFDEVTTNSDAPHECLLCKRPSKNFEGYFRHHRICHKEEDWEKCFRIVLTIFFIEAGKT